MQSKLSFFFILTVFIVISSCKKTSTTSVYYQKNVLVSTLAGNGSTSGIDGTSVVASFFFPRGIALNSIGNIYVADWGNNKIRIVDPSGNVKTLAGNDSIGAIDSTGANATFYYPSSVAVSNSNDVYVADYHNNTIRKIAPSGLVTTFLGLGFAGFTNGNDTVATFRSPAAIAMNDSGEIFVADWGNNAIRKISKDGVATTFAGNGTLGFQNGIDSLSTFNGPNGIAVDKKGNVFVADTYNNVIRKITKTGVVSTFAGSGVAGSTDSVGKFASFNHPFALAIDSANNIYVADRDNNKIRKISPSSKVTTIAGNGSKGNVNGIGKSASFNQPQGVAVNLSGSIIYVSDTWNNCIRKIIIE